MSTSDSRPTLMALAATLADARQPSIAPELLAVFLGALLAFAPGTPVSAALADGMIAEVDERLSEQLSAILHHPRFQRLESSWRALCFLVERVDFRQNILLEYLSVSRDDLLADFDDAPDITLSGLYRHVYTAEYGQFGGHPIGVIVANYELDSTPADLRLLTHAASVGAMAHAPFIAGVDKRFFGLERWDQFPNIRDFSALFEMPNYAHWRSFRASEDARYALPRFLFRPPYGANSLPARSFNFAESRENPDALCWGNAAFALADRMADSFARYRWCVNIVGPEGGGVVENLPLWALDTHNPGFRGAKIPTQILLSEQREFEMAEAGFIGLALRKGSNDAVFFSAASCQSAQTLQGGIQDREAGLNYKLAAQLPYMMLMNRLAHYLKVLQRENLGLWKTREVMEMELNKWLNRYVSEMDNPDPVTRSRRPLRQARIAVTEAPDNSDWYLITIRARPHFKFMGANFTLSLTGKLDKE